MQASSSNPNPCLKVGHLNAYVNFQAHDTQGFFDRHCQCGLVLEMNCSKRRQLDEGRGWVSTNACVQLALTQQVLPILAGWQKCHYPAGKASGKS